jgi:hypothetical protein
MAAGQATLDDYLERFGRDGSALHASLLTRPRGGSVRCSSTARCRA